MKKAVAVILVFNLLFLLCSCTADSQALEIRHRLIVQAIGIDKGENGKIRMSVQALNTDVSTNASSNSTPEKLVNVYTIDGESLADCAEKLRLLTGKNPLLSQNRIVVFSYEIAVAGIGKLLDSFIRNNENRFNVLAAVSEGSAEEIINANPGDNIIGARLIEKQIENSGNDIIRTKIYEITNCILDGNKSAVLPVISVKADSDGDRIIYNEIAVFKGDRLSFTLPQSTVTGINFINNSVKSGEISFDNISLNLLKSRTSVKVKNTDGCVSFGIKVCASLVLTEIADSITDSLDKTKIKLIKTQAENEIKSYIQTALDECIIKGGADAFGFSRRLWQRFPDFYREHESNIIGVLQNADYEIFVTVNIIRTGDSVIKQ